MSARDDILTRLRPVTGERLAFRGHGEDAPPRPPSAVTTVDGDATVMARRFGDELKRVLGRYEIVEAGRVIGCVVDRCEEWARGPDRAAATSKVLSWATEELPVNGLHDALCARGMTVLVSDDLHDASQRDEAAAAEIGLTSVTAAFAGTGSVVLTPAAGRARAASLLPSKHLLLVPFSRLYPTVEAWLAGLRAEGRLLPLLRERRQWAFVTGPSKSADIELNLTVGVHGPGEVHAVLFDDR